MLEIRRDAEIFATDGGWFSARWHFSFGGYHDPANMGIGPLRVFNDDRLIPGAIWPMHPHADVEGITYVVEGTFRHQDDVGGGGVLQAGAVQRMTLGRGANHSEQNGSETEPMRFLQFWILPDTPGLEPGVEQRGFSADDVRDRLRQVLGPAGDEDVVTVHQDARAYVARLSPGVRADHAFAEGRAGYLYLMDGEATLDDTAIATGDAAKIYGPHDLTITGGDAHLILIDVPARYEPVGVWAVR